MVTIRFCTTSFRPPRLVTLRTGPDGWEKRDIGGTFRGDSWYFTLTGRRYETSFKFKFVLDQIHWMNGADLEWKQDSKAAILSYEERQIQFDSGPDRRNPPVVEAGWVQQRLLPPTIDDWRVWDVIVIGSGMGGGIVAERLADPALVDGKDKAPYVLVLEAGSFLVPHHVANLPRQHHIGKFDKHVWHLWDELQVRDYTNTPASKYRGGQGINFGGRSVFWGGLIPRMRPWEFDSWPAEIKNALLDAPAGGRSYYDEAEATMNMHRAPDTPYQQRVKTALENKFKDWSFEDAPSAIQIVPPESSGIAAGMFSTADLLTESRLTDIESHEDRLFVNLNHPVERIEAPESATRGGPGHPLRVYARDRLSDEERVYRAKRVVLAAGSLESPMVVLRSNLQKRGDKVGHGFTDHPVFYSHFGLPRTSDLAPHNETGVSCKLVARHKGGKTTPFNILIEIGADLLHGRYLDPEILAQQQAKTKDTMLCEIVFVYEAPLVEQNRVKQGENGVTWPVISMAPCPVIETQIAELRTLRDEILTFLGGMKLAGDLIHDEVVNLNAVGGQEGTSPANVPFCRARLGAAGHEVGTLRLGTDGSRSVVDSNLQFRACENLYACDLSVFPTAPAANPSLTLAALAIRLADHLRADLGVPPASRRGAGGGT